MAAPSADWIKFLKERGYMSKRLTVDEKETLIKRFKSHPEIGIGRFCMANNISTTAFRKWLVAYDALGKDGLLDKRLTDSTISKYLPEADDPSDKDKDRALMIARIENERLKKNYVQIQTPDGEYVYVPLKKKTTE